jgi:hypothetical protein
MTVPKKARSPAARARRAKRRRDRKRLMAATRQITEAQDKYLAGDVGELTDFELKILDTIHGDD